MLLPAWSQVWFLVFPVIAVAVGAYFGAYFREKGKNLATKEDFIDLKEQTRALTQATKEIEAIILVQRLLKLLLAHCRAEFMV